MDAIDTPNHDDLHLGRVDFGIRQMRDKIRCYVTFCPKK